MRFSLSKYRMGFMTSGDCWKLFQLPVITRYYNGKMKWISWWRFYFIIDNFHSSYK